MSIPNIAQIIYRSCSKSDFMKRLNNISDRDIKRIELRTRKQSKTYLWHHFRKSCITATIIKRSSKAGEIDENNENLNDAIAKTQCTALWYPAVVWGRTNEQNGINAFMKAMRSKHSDLKAHSAGLMLDKEMPFIAGSIDAKLTCSCHAPAILEIKCPYSIRNTNKFSELPYLDDNLKLRRNHIYYFQLMTYLGIYNYQIGYFCVWTPKAIHIEQIQLDNELWQTLKRNSCKYYLNHYLNQQMNSPYQIGKRLPSSV